jgi:hypothetical protein
MDQGRKRLEELWAENGRDGRPQIALASRLHLTAPDISNTIRLAKAFEEVKVDHLISYATTKRSVDENIQRMERLAREVMPELAGAQANNVEPRINK